MERKVLQQIIKSASGQTRCDLLLENITVIDVLNCTRFIDDVAIDCGRFVGFGKGYEASRVVDCTGKYIVPGLVDAHCHIESSSVTPREYTAALIKHGITTVICDPHEIANVVGVEGIEWIMNESNQLPLNFIFMLPSCVPATGIETSGATLSASNLKPLLSLKNVYGLAEVMDSFAVFNTDDDMMDKITNTHDSQKYIDGHASGLNEKMLNAYAVAGISSDHECENSEEVIERTKRGMYAFLRQGSAARNLSSFVDAIKVNNGRRMCLCSDDKHIDEIIAQGTINHSIKLLISYGIRAEVAISMATINPSHRFALKNSGAIIPGFKADFLILDDLENFNISHVYKDGVLACDVANGEKLYFGKSSNPFDNTIKLPLLNAKSFGMPLHNCTSLNVIGVNKGLITTEHLIYDTIQKENFEADVSNDLVKIAVIERHGVSGSIGKGIIHGLQIKRGAVATTVSHDSHQLVVCGVNDDDMLMACEMIRQIGGGNVVVCDGKLLACLPLDVGGIMSSSSADVVLTQIVELKEAVNQICSTATDLFMPLSFMVLPVIPKLKMTSRGLYDVVHNCLIDYVNK